MAHVEQGIDATGIQSSRVFYVRMSPYLLIKMMEVQIIKNKTPAIAIVYALS